MDFMTAVKTCFAKFADFSGRATRSEYWWFVLAYFVLALVGSFIHQYVYFLVVLVFLVPMISAGVRRLHDIGKTGWLLLIGIIPLVGLVLIYFMVQPSQAEANQYGAPPVA
ncbi:DUF805 domain-containing protein [Xenophilus arseniciresistens]|uniref:DUF805 domain-containing protein n=1 Tax=Xenophilus arseniciresistens TaxID=1283306 RepID=A0AAE3SZ41_9BURK|nr:DUF805 domain-containing protein [Xenophilus arseniciresistens]MDA7416747.1 DUF805 domain-containing protein [Xenophilus arseniciresistens]